MDFPRHLEHYSNFRGPAFLILVLGAYLGSGSPALAQGLKLEVAAYPNVSAVTAGKPFEVAFRLQIEDGWHTYWLNSGDSGLPPAVKWALPSGFEASELRHPVPKRYVEAGGLTTFIHEGQPILTAGITPPADLQARAIEFKGDMVLLVCKEQCIRVTKPFAFKLPVADVDAQIKPANEQIFSSAQNAFPKSTSHAKYVKILPMVNVDKVRPKDKFTLALVVEVDPGFHIQSHEPLAENYIATDVFLERTADITFGRAEFPQHKVRVLSGNMKVAEYAGRVVIEFDAKADNTISAEVLRFAGILRYQACNDAGTCYRPLNIFWETTVATAAEGEAVRTINGEYFRAAPAVGDKPATKSTSIDRSLPGAPKSKSLDSLLPVVSNVPSTPVTSGPTDAQPDSESPAPSVDTGEEKKDLVEQYGLAGLLLGCFIYGLFLNATPCVLPLLSIKVLGFVQQAHESRRRTFGLGLSFGLGVIIFFVILGFVSAAGKNMLQYPVVIIGLSTVVMALALSMLGVYTLRVPTTAAKIEATIKQEGMIGSFGKGALAPILGFACTGPMLAAAFGWATQQEPHVAIFAFVFAGLGMAFPYILLGANPNWLSFLPKPGMWMITFEHIMGFLLLGMVIWLMSPLVVQIGAEGLEWTLVFMVAVAMACWLLGKIEMTMSAARRWKYRGGAIALIVVAGVYIYGVQYPLAEAEATEIAKRNREFDIPGQPGPSDKIAWQRWSVEAVDEAVRSGKTVFVDFTAAWCTVCKVNKKVAVNTPEVIAKLQAHSIVTFQGDFTSEDAQIAAELKKHGRAGLPFDLIFPAGKPDNPIVLRPNLTKRYLLGKLDEAGPSTAE